MLPVGEGDFLAAAQQFQEATGKPLLATWTNGLSRNWMALVYQQNGTIEGSEGMPTIDSEEVLNALNFLIVCAMMDTFRTIPTIRRLRNSF